MALQYSVGRARSLLSLGAGCRSAVLGALALGLAEGADSFAGDRQPAQHRQRHRLTRMLILLAMLPRRELAFLDGVIALGRRRKHEGLAIFFLVLHDFEQGVADVFRREFFACLAEFSIRLGESLGEHAQELP